jgi:hypothetical protein
MVLGKGTILSFHGNSEVRSLHYGLVDIPKGGYFRFGSSELAAMVKLNAD